MTEKQARDVIHYLEACHIAGCIPSYPNKALKEVILEGDYEKTVTAIMIWLSIDQVVEVVSRLDKPAVWSSRVLKCAPEGVLEAHQATSLVNVLLRERDPWQVAFALRYTPKGVLSKENLSALVDFVVSIVPQQKGPNWSQYVLKHGAGHLNQFQKMRLEKEEKWSGHVNI